MKPQEELQQVLKLLLAEKEAERIEFDQMLKQSTLKQKLEQGVTWFPLSLENQGYGLGEYPYITVERTKYRDSPHKFKGGQPVTLYSQAARELADKESGPTEISGTINYVDKNRMKISFTRDNLPDWITKGKIGVEVAFDTHSYREMERAMDVVINAKDSTRLAYLRDVLYGKIKPEYAEHPIHLGLTYLNASQKATVEHILASEDVAIVHGPPGTGKTTTLVQAIAKLSQTEKRILVCAPSNPAVDLLTEKLAEEGLNVLRIGNLSRIDESLLQHTVEGKLSKRAEMEEVKKMKMEAAQLRRKAESWSRNYNASAREAKQQLWDEMKQVTAHARMLEDYVVKKVITEADVICCTLVGAQDRYLDGMQFGTVVIDEAAQALEPSCWIPILRAKRVVLAGDPYQLPPTVKSTEAMKGGFGVTLMEKSLKRLPDVKLLAVQYRMNDVIMNFSNEQLYGGELSSADYVKYRTVVMEGGTDQPLEFVDTAGCGFDEKLNPETLSRYNKEEYHVLRMHLDDILARSKDRKYSIGIISPYKEQVTYIQSQIKEDFDHFPEADITVNTIDAFQGQERDIIYISLVRSNDKGEIGFLSDVRRMNVAMTRAKLKLVVIGDSATIAKNKFYQAFLDYCDRTDSYRTAWEFM